MSNVLVASHSRTSSNLFCRLLILRQEITHSFLCSILRSFILARTSSVSTDSTSHFSFSQLLSFKVNEPVSSKKESDNLGREQKAHVHSKSGCCRYYLNPVTVNLRHFAWDQVSKDEHKMASWFFLTGLLHSPHGNLGLSLPFAGSGLDDISPQTRRSRCICKVLAPFTLYWTLPAKYRFARERRMKGALTTCFSKKNASEALNLRSTCEYGQIVSLYSKVRSGNTRIITQKARI